MKETFIIMSNVTCISIYFYYKMLYLYPPTHSKESISMSELFYHKIIWAKNVIKKCLYQNLSTLNQVLKILKCTQTFIQSVNQKRK